MLTRSKRSLPFGASIPSKIQKPPAIPLLSYINKRNLIYTFSIESANTAIESAKIESYIGFDIEWKIQWKRGAEQYKTALIQICTSTEIILFHISRMKSIPISLLSLLTNPNVLKTGVGIKGDAFRIHRDFNIEMKGIVDLAQCFKQFPDSGGWNLQSMLERYCKTSLDKDESVRKGNWEREPLNEMQIEYAANDAFASYLLHESFLERMKIENNDSILVISEDVGTLLEQKRISQEAQAEFYKQQQSEKQEVANDGYFYDQNEQEVESQSERSKQDCVNDQEEDAESVEESYPNSKEMEKMRQLL